ncbi:hypothetical protein L596_020778 [Steinernema carpocapsae]|uniref:Uncharacterized protein n=1 Tax=Steinernema carpocapsae TaxID=34508 RepID=A0A4U5MUI6_STECR|nr:hypothetical protein L596_020778 [Steinernema carpocapsae]
MESQDLSVKCQKIIGIFLLVCLLIYFYSITEGILTNGRNATNKACQEFHETNSYDPYDISELLRRYRKRMAQKLC